MIYCQGVHWPDLTDLTSIKNSFEYLEDARASEPFWRRRRTVVQAGGNVGLWPGFYSRFFDRVWTFEPDLPSYNCLATNMAVLPNVWPVHAALSYKPELIGLQRRNLTAHHVDGAGCVPAITIDSLGLVDCDLIQLDVEGFELTALRGAERTLRECRPVLQLEIGDHAHRYGHDEYMLRAMLDGYGYREVNRIHYDVIFAPR